MGCHRRSWLGAAVSSGVACCLTGRCLPAATALPRYGPQGKSVLCAALAIAPRLDDASTTLAPSGSGGCVAAAAQPPPLLLADASFFCTRLDSRTRDPVIIARTVAYQLALRFPPVAEALLALDPAAVAAVEDLQSAYEMLLQGPLGSLKLLSVSALSSASSSSSSSSSDSTDSDGDGNDGSSSNSGAASSAESPPAGSAAAEAAAESTCSTEAGSRRRPVVSVCRVRA